MNTLAYLKKECQCLEKGKPLREMLAESIPVQSKEENQGAVRPSILIPVGKPYLR